MAPKKGTSTPGYISNYLEAQNHSSEKERDAETFEFVDFEPIMVMFRCYRPELSEAQKQSIMNKGLANLR